MYPLPRDDQLLRISSRHTQCSIDQAPEDRLPTSQDQLIVSDYILHCSNVLTRQVQTTKARADSALHPALIAWT
jgi:hypothetical protein